MWERGGCELFLENWRRGVIFVRKIMKKLIGIMIMSLAAVVTSCGGAATTEETIASVRQSMKSGDYDLASRTIEACVEDVDSEERSVAELSELAMLAMRLSVESPDYGDALSALTLYDRATAKSRDSVEIFTIGLPVEEAQYLVMLRNLQRAREIDAASLPDHEEDYGDEAMEEEEGR